MEYDNGIQDYTFKLRENIANAGSGRLMKIVECKILNLKEDSSEFKRINYFTPKRVQPAFQQL